MSTEFWTAGIVLIVLGGIAVLAGVFLESYSRKQLPYRGYARAKVVEILTVPREKGSRSEFRNRQAAVFEFYANGRLRKITDTTDVYPCPYKLHQTVRLSYSPANLQKYTIIEEERLFVLAKALNVLGVALILGGLISFLRYATRYY